MGRTHFSSAVRGCRCCGVVFVGRVCLACLRQLPQREFQQSQARPSGSAGYTAAVRARGRLKAGRLRGPRACRSSQQRRCWSGRCPVRGRPSGNRPGRSGRQAHRARRAVGIRPRNAGGPGAGADCADASTTIPARGNEGVPGKVLESQGQTCSCIACNCNPSALITAVLVSVSGRVNPHKQGRASQTSPAGRPARTGWARRLIHTPQPCHQGAGSGLRSPTQAEHRPAQPR